MNVLKIDVLSATPVEPVRDVSAHHSMSRAERPDRDYSQITIAGAEKPFGNEHGEPATTTTEAHQADSTRSHNIAPAVQKSSKELPNRDFENVLKRQLKQSDSEQNTEDVSPETQNFGTDGKAEQVLVLTALQNGITVLAEQKQPVTNGETVQNQPSQPVQNVLTNILNSAPNEALVVAGGDVAVVTENKEQGVTWQSQVTSDAAQNQAKVTQAMLLTPGQNATVQQGDAQGKLATANEQLSNVDTSHEVLLLPGQNTAIQQGDGQDKMAAVKESSSNTDTGQTRGDAITVPQRVTDNSVKIDVPVDSGGAGKSAEAAKQVSSANTESVNLSGRQEVVQSNEQFAAVVSAGTTTELKDGKQAAESVTAGGRQAGLEMAYRNRIKDGSGRERQINSNTLSNGSDKVETASVILKDKLNVEKVELSSGKSDTIKPEQGIVAPQSARTQMPVFDAGQVISDRPITADTANVVARNASMNDTAAAIRDQIFQSVQTSIQQGQREITVHLNPPDLGRVSIKFSEQGKELTGLLETANPQTRAEIRQAIPEIIRSLEESGISIKRLDVTLSDSSGRSDLSRQSAQDLLRDNSSKDLWQQLGNQNFNDAGGNRSPYDSLAATGHFSGASEFSGGILTEPNQSSRSDTLLDVFI